MTHVFNPHPVRRPRTLVRAARFALMDYRRDRDLRRLLKTERAPAPGPALQQLMEIEETMNKERRDGGARYSIARHILLLAAIMGEMQLQVAASQPSGTP